MKKFLLSLALVLLSGAAVAQSTINLTFNRNNSAPGTDATVTVTGDITGVTSTVSCNLNWKAFGANSETFPNASILCPDKNTKDMTPGNEGVITFTLAGFSSAYEITKVTFTSVALNGSGAFQGDNANSQHIDFILLDQNDCEIARTENVEIKVNSNGGDNVEVSLNPNSPIKVTTDGINTLKLKLVNNYDARGCFYGLYNISLTVEPAEPAEPELPTNTLPTFQLKKSPLSASELMSKTESCYIAIKNISQLNDAWYAGEVVGETKRHSKYEFDQSTIFIWEPVVAGQAGSYRLRQLDGDYMQGDSPANFGTIDNAATFVVVNPGVGKTGNEAFNGDSGSMAFLLNGTKDPFLVRFVCGDKWINVARFQNSPKEVDYLTQYNTGTGGFTINYAYEVIPTDGFEVNISDAKYSTMYTSYNVALPGGLSAYIVDGLKEGDDTRVNLVKINSEIVPAFTPVIL